MPLVAGEQASVGGDDPQRLDDVRGRAELSRREADAAAEGKPAERDGRAGPGRDGQALGGQGGVDVDQPPPRSDHGALPLEADALKPAQVDDHAGAGRPACVAVAARARNDCHAVPPGPADHGLHVLRVVHAHDGERTHAVEALVVDEARGAVAGRAGGEHRSRDEAVELRDARIRARGERVSEPSEGASGRDGTGRGGEQLPAVERAHDPSLPDGRGGYHAGRCSCT